MKIMCHPCLFQSSSKLRRKIFPAQENWNHLTIFLRVILSSFDNKKSLIYPVLYCVFTHTRGWILLKCIFNILLNIFIEFNKIFCLNSIHCLISLYFAFEVSLKFLSKSIHPRKTCIFKKSSSLSNFFLTLLKSLLCFLKSDIFPIKKLNLKRLRRQNGIKSLSYFLTKIKTLFFFLFTAS